MNCPKCGAGIESDALVCGNCGAIVQNAAHEAQTQPFNLPHVSRRRRWLSSSTLIVFFFACGLFTIIAASAIGGVVVGLQDRDADRQAQIDKYYQEGLTNFAAGKLELAKADFEYVLKLNPNYPGAREQYTQVQARLTVKPTPTSPAMTNAIDQLYQKGQTAYGSNDWATAVEVFSQVRTLNPAYHTEQVNQMIYTAALTYGLELLKQDRLEEGIAYLDQAAYVQSLPEEAALQAQYARLYVTARGYWNVNWEKAIERFKELYAIAPGYQDVFTRLVEAYVNFGDEQAHSNDFCAAKDQYAAANQLRPDPNLQTKIDEAQQQCLAQPTSPVSGTAQTIAGLFAGRLAYPVFDASSGTRIDAASAGNPTIFVAAVGDQPEWQRNGPLLVYRVSGVGLNLVDFANGTSRAVGPAGAAWPTFSPDGSRLIYALQGRLYMIRLDGSGAPIDLGAGAYPVWGPKGSLAYSGCDAAGTCGIMLRNPDSTEPPTRLTASGQAIPTSWSADWVNIAYFSDVTGAYNLFCVNAAGGVQQGTNTPGNDIAGAWGPDGAHIAFLSDRDGSWAVYIAKFDGSEAQKIAVAPQGSDWVNQRLSWMP